MSGKRKVRDFTDLEVLAWVERHDLENAWSDSISAARCAMQDASSILATPVDSTADSLPECTP